MPSTGRRHHGRRCLGYWRCTSSSHQTALTLALSDITTTATATDTDDDDDDDDGFQSPYLLITMIRNS